MSAVLEDGTISMILTLPSVKELANFDEDQSALSEDSKPPSIPIYHGSILHIEQHQDDRNKSDLIVRVPNFHHVTLPSVTITINQREGSVKRRAPICPIISGTNEQSKTPPQPTSPNPKRFVVGLRNLRRAVITNFRVKSSTNSNQITLIPVLPDVEVIREKFDVTPSQKKTRKTSGSTSRFFAPKILFIKRKYLKMIKNRQSSGNSIQAQTDSEADQTNESSRANFHLNVDEFEQQQNQANKSDVDEKNTSFVSEIEQPSNTAEIPVNIRPPEIFISNSTIDLIPEHKDHVEEDDVEGTIYVVHPDGDTYSECYEVTYEFDPEFQRFIDQNKERIGLPEIPDASENEESPSSPSPPPPLPSNDYENIEQTPNDFSITPTPRVKFLSFDDFLQPDPAYECEPPPTSSFSEENSPSINEDYTIILQFLKHALQLESMPDADCNEFNKQIKQIFEKENSD